MSNAYQAYVGLNEPFPGRKVDMTGTGMNLDLLKACRKTPQNAYVVVNIMIFGRSYRWSTMPCDIPCAEVQGGFLHFEGKLTGTGELSASIEILERLSDVATFSVTADNSEYLGMNLGVQQPYVRGQVVPSLHGSRVEISMVHKDVDWSKRYVVLYGYIGNAQYGINGEALTFQATSEWSKIDRKAGCTITNVTVNRADDLDTFGSEVGVSIGSGYTEIKLVGDGASGIYQPYYTSADYSAGWAACYIVSVNWVGNGVKPWIIQNAKDSDGVLYSTSNVRRVTLLDGTPAEVVFVAGTNKSTLFLNKISDENGWFGYREIGTLSASPPSNHYPSGALKSPVSIGYAIAYWLNRVGSGSPLDIDYSGAMQLQRLGCASYNIPMSGITTARDVLENRIVLQTYGFISNRFGKYGFHPYPFPSTFGGCPLVKATLVFGDELLDRSALTEVGGDDVTNDYSVQYRNDPSKGEYTNGQLQITNEVNGSNSYWPMLSNNAHGRGSYQKMEMPDLQRWYDVRSATRVEERIGGFVLREITYTGLASLARLSAGDVVRVIDADIGFKAVVDADDPNLGKCFIVLEVSIKVEAIVTIRLREWPLLEDFAPNAVIGSGFSTFTPVDPQNPGLANQG